METPTTESGSGRGLSRRNLIKGAAAAGTAAWVAPVILQSLTSPAAAASGAAAPGSYLYVYKVTYASAGGCSVVLQSTGDCALGDVGVPTYCQGATRVQPATPEAALVTPAAICTDYGSGVVDQGVTFTTGAPNEFTGKGFIFTPGNLCTGPPDYDGCYSESGQVINNPSAGPYVSDGDIWTLLVVVTVP